jgi:hypothetical protein
VCLRFVFLLAVVIPAWLRISRRPPAWKDARSFCCAGLPAGVLPWLRTLLLYQVRGVL